MSSISSLIDVFRMDEINKRTRAKVIIQLGRSINNSMGSNITAGLVYELVTILDPTNEILSNEHYKRFID